MGQFGEKFRKEREKKNFSLDDVASVTKIGTRMLQAIEEENFDRLPGGVFNKGFIRTYAKHLGMNDDKAVADYLACTQRTEDVPSAPSTQNRAASPQKRPAAPSKKNSPKQSAKPPASTEVDELPDLQLPRAEHVRPPQKKFLDDREHNIPWGLLALAGVVIVIALFLWNRHSRNAHAQSAASPARSASPSAPKPAAAPATASYQTASARSTSSNSAPAPATQHPAASQSGSPATKPLAAGANDSTATANPPAATSAPLTLIIRAAENSWISVRADGQEITAETLIAPAHTSVRAAREIVVKTGNAAGVNFLWNGKEVPAQGAEAEVRTIVFDADGVHTTPVAQPIQNQ